MPNPSVLGDIPFLTTMDGVLDPATRLQEFLTYLFKDATHMVDNEIYQNVKNAENLIMCGDFNDAAQVYKDVFPRNQSAFNELERFDDYMTSVKNVIDKKIVDATSILPEGYSKLVYPISVTDFTIGNTPFNIRLGDSENIIYTKAARLKNGNLPNTCCYLARDKPTRLPGDYIFVPVKNNETEAPKTLQVVGELEFDIAENESEVLTNFLSDNQKPLSKGSNQFYKYPFDINNPEKPAKIDKMGNYNIKNLTEKDKIIKKKRTSRGT